MTDTPKVKKITQADIRRKKKEKTQRKKLERKLQNTDLKIKPSEDGEKRFDRWEELEQMHLTCVAVVQQYLNIATTSMGIVGELLASDKERANELIGLQKAVVEDANYFVKKSKELQKGYDGKSGDVDPMDLPDYIAQFSDVISLTTDVNTAMQPNCERITTIIESIQPEG